MRVAFRRSFLKDVDRIDDKRLRERLAAIIVLVESAQRLQEIPNLRRLSADGPYFRVRPGDYRIGLAMQSDSVEFVRVLHRREVYRYFP